MFNSENTSFSIHFKSSSNKGFTLLELLISIGILTLMTVTIAVTTQNALKTKNKVQQSVDDQSQARDALRLIEKDLNLAYHARDLEREFIEAAKKEYDTLKSEADKKKSGTGEAGGLAGGTASNPNLNPNQTPNLDNPLGPGSSLDKDSNPLNKYLAGNPSRKSPETDFFGKEEEMYFATRNAPRFLEGIPQADFIKVGYQLTSCQKPGLNLPSVRCLVRKTSPVVEGDIQQLEHGSVLLIGIKKFQLRYLGAGKLDWVKEWKSKEGDGATNGNYPQAVEITLVLEREDNGKTREVDMQIVANIRFPNNKEASL